ncbi:MAG TPA: nucleotide exchange factor GrpE, partial [Thermodesulfobacteriota bacterium]|nr:nucleotide exchange factor GrpE [Thermodesulfobacteriota bacterium]
MNKKEENGKKKHEGASKEVKLEGKEGQKFPGEEKKAEEKRESTPLEKLQAQLEEKTRESSEYFDKWLRLRAEFENFKKRMQKERADLLKFGNESLLKALLPVLDNLSRAIEHGKNAKESSPLLEGVEMVQKEFLTALDKFGVKSVQAVGEVFDPERHEAVSQAESELEPNRVISAVQSGYFYHD